MSQIREVTSGLRFPEGPVGLADGTVLVVEVAAGVLTRVYPDGSKEVVVETGGGPNGAAVGPDGCVYICNSGGLRFNDDLEPIEGIAEGYEGGYIQRVDLASGTCDTLYTHCGDRQLRAPNDIVFDETGGFWFTDFGKVEERWKDRGSIYYAAADGSMITEAVAPIDGPNGIGLSPDGCRLYAAQTFEGRAWAWDLSGPGVIDPAQLAGAPFMVGPGGSTLLAGVPGFQLFDSMAVDGVGHVCVATLLSGGITVIEPGGDVVDFIETGDPLTTNICFGGPDCSVAYITVNAIGRLLAMDWPWPGLALNFADETPALKMRMV